jgi:hypothetical protein
MRKPLTLDFPNKQTPATQRVQRPVKESRIPGDKSPNKKTKENTSGNKK